MSHILQNSGLVQFDINVLLMINLVRSLERILNHTSLWSYYLLIFQMQLLFLSFLGILMTNFSQETVSSGSGDVYIDQSIFTAEPAQVQAQLPALLVSILLFCFDYPAQILNSLILDVKFGLIEDRSVHGDQVLISRLSRYLLQVPILVLPCSLTLLLQLLWFLAVVVT